MKLIFTVDATNHLNEALDYLEEKGVGYQTINNIRDGILEATEVLLAFPEIVNTELALEHLKMGHRRLIKGHYKIIYRIDGDYIFITDIFDTRQDPAKMKG